IQRRATACGGRRKTQPTVRDGLTTTTTGEELWAHGVKVDHPPQSQESQESSTHIREEEAPHEEYLADSTQAFSSEGCLDAWITAYRKEIGVKP
ncbi:hypothetical protein, partial [Pseudomonas aeruginosa]